MSKEVTKYKIKTSSNHSNVLNFHIIEWEKSIFIANLHTNLKL